MQPCNHANWHGLHLLQVTVVDPLCAAVLSCLPARELKALLKERGLEASAAVQGALEKRELVQALVGDK